MAMPLNFSEDGPFSPTTQIQNKRSDVYGRLVGLLFVNGKDLGAQLVRQGSVMAWDGFVGRCDDLDYSELEEMAQDAGLGLWSASTT